MMSEVDLLIGDASKAKNLIGWEATIKFEDLVKEMMQADLDLMSDSSNTANDSHQPQSN